MISEGKNVNDDKDLKIFLGLCTLFIIAVITLPKNILVNSARETKKINSDGVEELHQMEKKEVYEVESEIESVQLQHESEKNIEETQETGPIDYTEGIDVQSYNYKALFANSVIMGDSIAEGLEYYNVLESSSVVARIGANMASLENEYATVTALSPKNIFLYYGINDIAYIHDDYEKFRGQYEKVITRLKQDLPRANIYANMLFPVINLDREGGEYYADLTPYNQIIKEVCEQYGVVCLDNTGIVKEEYYEPDGMHFKMSFYSYWLYSMALGAGMIK